MANQKSQIYPIQLQGAELNLNKFDGEIKQYSGFNKNNSPFVGGCLSNLFTKSETLDGANANNTYIAPNGDVYKATSEGLFKNGNKILDIDIDNLYDIEKLDIPYDTVDVFDEYSFIYKRFNYYTNLFDFYFRFYDFNAETWREELITSYSSISDIILYSERIHFDDKYVWCVGWKTRTLQVNYCPSYCNFTLFSSQVVANNVVYSKNSVTDIYQNDAFYRRYAIHLGIHILYNDVLDKVYIALFTSSMDSEVAPHNPNVNKFCLIYSADINNSGNITFTQTKALTGNASGDSDYYVFEGEGFTVNNLRTLDNTQNTFMYFTCQNKLYLEHFYNFTGAQQCSYKIVKDSTTGIKIVFYNPLYCDFSNNDNLLNYNDDRYVFFRNGVLTRGYRYLSENPYSVCDFENNFLSNEPVVAQTLYFKFNVGAILNECILLNNEHISGLTLPHTQSILVANWNTVDEKNVYLRLDGDYDYKDGAIIFYKDSSTFYKIKKTNVVKLFKKDNQLVVNSDIVPNSYRMTDGNTLLFAPSWNNRFKGIPATDFANTWYVASSVNEYNLQNNPSIIINPVPVLGRPNVNLALYKLLQTTYSNIVNFYYSKTSACGYHFSAKDGDINNVVVVEDLENLTFPSDTEGNVLYSPSLFSEFKDSFGNKVFVKTADVMYPLVVNNNIQIMAYYLASGIENFEVGFIIQGQFYGIMNNGLYSLQYANGVISDVSFIVSVEGLQFCGSSPYEALFFSKTNRCLYSFVGANTLQQKQLVDKISQIFDYIYNPATQTIFLLTDIGVIFYSVFGQFLYEKLTEKTYLLNNGVCFSLGNGKLEYIKYYLDEGDSGYIKNNIELETCFYGMNNQTVTINDCLYLRLFSEEHEEGDLKVSATTLSLEGRKTEDTVFKIKESDWDKMTHSIYLRYQPKEQRGLGISFSIDSPFKIASLSVGSQADAVLIDKVSKGAINRPQITSNNTEW